MRRIQRIHSAIESLECRLLLAADSLADGDPATTSAPISGSMQTPELLGVIEPCSSFVVREHDVAYFSGQSIMHCGGGSTGDFNLMFRTDGTPEGTWALGGAMLVIPYPSRSSSMKATSISSVPGPTVTARSCTDPTAPPTALRSLLPTIIRCQPPNWLSLGIGSFTGTGLQMTSSRQPADWWRLEMVNQHSSSKPRVSRICLRFAVLKTSYISEARNYDAPTGPQKAPRSSGVHRRPRRAFISGNKPRPSNNTSGNRAKQRFSSASLPIPRPY